MAALHAYAGFPPEVRLALAREYAAQVAANELTKSTAAAEPRPAKKNLLADLKARKQKGLKSV